MKKILVIVVFVFITSYGYAQDIKYGVKAGLNLTNVVGDDVEDVDMKSGLYLGAFLTVPLNDNLTFQPELLYSRQGWKEEVIMFGNAKEDVKIKTSYLNIPLLLKMGLGSSEKAHFYAGPQMGFLLKAESEYDDNDNDIKDVFDNVDFSLNIGFSFVVSDNMSLDVRYNRGISKIMDEGNIKAYNSGFQLGASYTF